MASLNWRSRIKEKKNSNVQSDFPLLVYTVTDEQLISSVI